MTKFNRSYKVIWLYAAKIWGANSNKELHIYVWKNYKCDSLTKLPWQDYYDLQDKLQHLANPTGATPKQLKVMRSIKKQLGGDARRLSGIVYRQTGKRSVYDLSKKEVTKVITGFNKMMKSNQVEAGN